MNKEIVFLDGWPLIEKICGVRNFTESLLEAIAQYRPDIPVHVAIPVFPYFEKQYHYENIERIRSIFAQKNNIQIHVYQLSKLEFSLILAAASLLGIKKQKTLARFFWHYHGIQKPIKNSKAKIVIYPTQEIGLKVKGTIQIGIIHDLFGFFHYPIYNKDRFFDLLLYRIMYGRVYKKNLKKLDQILTISNYTKIDINLYFGINFEKIQTVYEGASSYFEHFHPSKEKSHEIFERYRLPKKYILSSNPESYRKYPLTLLKAFQRIKHGDRDMFLVFFGTGNETEIVQTVNQLGLKDSVIFLSFIDLEDLPIIYHHAKCFVFNTLAEGFGLPVLEGIWSQTPVLASSIGVLHEVYKENILYFDPFDVDGLHAGMQRLMHASQEAITRQNRVLSSYEWKSVIQRIQEVVSFDK